MLDADITYYTIMEILRYIHDNDVLAADALGVRVVLPPLDTFQVTTTTFRPFIRIYSNFMILDSEDEEDIYRMADSGSCYWP